MIDISYTLANGWMFLDMISWETHAHKATHTLWISSDRVMCVHTLPRGKALSSSSACNWSGSEGKGRQEEEKFTNRKGKRNMLTLMPVLFQQGGLCLLLHSVADSRLLQAATSVEKSEERFCLVDQSTENHRGAASLINTYSPFSVWLSHFNSCTYDSSFVASSGGCTGQTGRRTLRRASEAELSGLGWTAPTETCSWAAKRCCGPTAWVWTSHRASSTGWTPTMTA